MREIVGFPKAVKTRRKSEFGKNRVHFSELYPVLRSHS